MSVSSFYSDSLSVIQRTVVARDQASTCADVDDYYETQRCAVFIKKHGFNKVALQFPDSLLGDAAAVAERLQALTSSLVFILGDTSYGSCCVDEVAAEHVGANAIIHFGRACLSVTERLPVLYIFGRGRLYAVDCRKKLGTILPSGSQRILVFCDVIYAHELATLQSQLREDYSHIVFSRINATENVPSRKLDSLSSDRIPELDCDCKSGSCCSKGRSEEKKGQVSGDSHEASPSNLQNQRSGDVGSGDNAQTSEEAAEESRNNQEIASESLFGRTFSLEAGTTVEDYSVLYIGGEGRTLTNLMMTLNKCPFYTYDPSTSVARREELNVSRALMRRYYLIERAKDANVVGIVAGTLGVARHLDVVSHLKGVLRHAGKKSYVFAVGKLNVAKLANFPEVDIYVMVACPENTLVDSKEFYRPVVTPYEMEIACNEAREWTGEYITDFQKILPGASKYVEVPTSSPAQSERTDVSLITGNLRSTRINEDDGSIESGALVKRNETLTVSNVHRNASEFLAGRSWQGLEQKVGETPVTKATEGRKGIAASYTHEQS
ncbi:2-(3-amino-3-carboxypropyl)histidine synthase subunit 2-like [Diadema antillarum]|uniref:2-(3-amino-3-carboxypropyl)histidine synthase subunit 2-like n=1 Tax=Diadema antillarum TaxID=105358 RepID=UPI003A86E1B9